MHAFSGRDDDDDDVGNEGQLLHAALVRRSRSLWPISQLCRSDCNQRSISSSLSLVAVQPRAKAALSDSLRRLESIGTRE